MNFDDINRSLQSEIDEAFAIDAELISYARRYSEAHTEYVIRDDSGNKVVNEIIHNRLHAAIRKFRKIVVRWPPEFGKTVQLTSIAMHIIGRNSEPAFKDKDPMYRGAIIGAKEENAVKSLGVIKHHFENNRDYKKVWPNLKKSSAENARWTDTAIDFERPEEIVLGDPSVQATGAGGAIIGSRLDWAIFDDIIHMNNTRTPEQREKLLEWFQSTMLTRLNDWAICVFLCNAWHKDDLANKLVNEFGWTLLEEPALEPDGTPVFPSRWPKERVDKRMEELGPIEGPKKLFHVMRDEKEMRFTYEDVGKCLKNGEGMSLMNRFSDSEGEWIVRCGVDLASAKKRSRTNGRKSGETVFFIGAYNKRTKKRRILNIIAGRMKGSQIMDTFYSIKQNYKGVIFTVENNGIQDLVVDLVPEDIPVRGVGTYESSHNPENGVEAISVIMSRGTYIIPCLPGCRPTGEINAFVNELYDYKPGEHRGDRLMACYMFEQGISDSEMDVSFRDRRTNRR